MAIFKIYKYEICKYENLQKEFEFDTDVQETNYDDYTHYNIFESLFGKAGQEFLGIVQQKERGNGDNKVTEYQPHCARIEQNINHIISLSMQANKTRTINQENWQTRKEPHHPDCRIMIDNRTNSHLLIIEKKASVFKDPDMAKNILEQSLNLKLRYYKLCISFTPLSKEIAFWDAVNEIRHKFEDKVNRVQFNFGQDTNNSNTQSSFIHRLIQWLSSTADNSNLIMNIGDDEKLQNITKDLTYMAELCQTNSNYDIIVQFNNFGLFRYGQTINAQYGMNDDDIERFVNIIQEPKLFEKEIDSPIEVITKWFDRVNILFKDYEENKNLVSRRECYNRI